jgi:hypothetical protein
MPNPRNPRNPRNRTRPLRKDSFFGLHFDLHPHDKDTELGKHVSEAMVRKIIRAARPDYIQYDCKGHVGYLGYPDSKVSAVAGQGDKGIVNDSLAIYRRATAAAGVALYVHFSGVWDGVAGRDHPEWLALAPDGKPYDNAAGLTSVFSAYTTERMIPQMKEVVDRYDVDGFWVDGDCWAVRLDYSPAVVEKFRAATGVEKAPTAPDQPGWVEWCEMHRERFFENLRTYMAAIHEHRAAPRPVQVASNWLYTPMSPEPVKLEVDFISGDYSHSDAVNSARWHGRYMANVGLPWDLMAWAFSTNGDQGHQYKPAEQLKQEAAAILVLGGGFQMYFHPDRHGGFADWHIQVMKEAADFCHERREVCHKSEPVPQVALLLDTTSFFRVTRGVYAPWAGEYTPAQGVLQQALEAGHSVDVLPDHQLVGQLDRWPVIVVPEWEHLATGFVRELVEYARRGGSLLVIGGRAVGQFREHLAVDFDGDPVDEKRYFQGNNISAKGTPPPGAKGLWQKVRPRNGKGGAKVLATATLKMVPDDSAMPAATVAPLGRGRIAGVYGPLGWCCFHNHSPWTRDLLDLLLSRLYDPVVRVTSRHARGLIDLVVRQKNDRLVVHLCNLAEQRYSSPHYLLTDTIPPIGPIELTIRRDMKPRRITLEPGGGRLPFKWVKRRAIVGVPALHIHHAMVIE